VQEEQQQQQQQQHSECKLAQHLQQSLAVKGTAQHSTTPSSEDTSSRSSRPALPALPAEADGLDLSAGPLPDSSIHDKALEKALMASSKPLYEAMVSLLLGCGLDVCRAGACQHIVVETPQCVCVWGGHNVQSTVLDERYVWWRLGGRAGRRGGGGVSSCLALYAASPRAVA
jgi:hypothetical protein